MMDGVNGVASAKPCTIFLHHWQLTKQVVCLILTKLQKQSVQKCILALMKQQVLCVILSLQRLLSSLRAIK